MLEYFGVAARVEGVPIVQFALPPGSGLSAVEVCSKTYSVEISSDNLTCILVVINQSGSVDEKNGNANITILLPIAQMPTASAFILISASLHVEERNSSGPP